MECRQTSRNAATCACGGLLYEDSRGWRYCVESDTLLSKATLVRPEPRHSSSCHRDEEGAWNCQTHCAVRMAQIGMFA